MSAEPTPVEAIDGLLALFDDAPVLALGEAHWVEQQHDLLRRLVLDERFGERVDAVVVEFGNSRYQLLIDRYLAGEDVAPGELRRVWSECVRGLGSRVFESPVYAAFFETVRALRATRGAAPRVLLGDPPFDRHRGDLERGLASRDEHFARVVVNDVLEHGGRALLLAGGGHFDRRSDLPEGNVVQRLEREALRSCAVVMPHYVFDDVAARRAGELAELERRLAPWPSPSIASIHGTWLGEIDAALILGDTARRIEPDGTTVEVHVPFLDGSGRPLARAALAEVADAYLYLGPCSSLTLSPPNAPG